MLTVEHDVSVVEAELAGGRLGCPGCEGLLRPWGWARRRLIREGMGRERSVGSYRPRRTRCSGCGATHVLLEVSLAARRADAAAVIAAAVESKFVAGHGHRVIAERLGRPTSTVRGWLRGFSAAAGRIAEAFSQLVLRDAGDAAAVWPAPAQHPGAQALGVLAAYASAVGQRVGIEKLTWITAGVRATSGWLFSPIWWSKIQQHQLTLTGLVTGTRS